MSAGRLNVLRAALVVGVLQGLFFAVVAIFFPQLFTQNEPVTPVLRVAAVFIGTFSFSWAVAAGIALMDPVKKTGLLQALIVVSLVLFLAGLYTDLVVWPAGASGVSWGSSIVSLILGVVLIIVYPRGQAAS